MTSEADGSDDGSTTTIIFENLNSPEPETRLEDDRSYKCPENLVKCLINGIIDGNETYLKDSVVDPSRVYNLPDAIKACGNNFKEIDYKLCTNSIVNDLPKMLRMAVKCQAFQSRKRLFFVMIGCVRTVLIVYDRSPNSLTLFDSHKHLCFPLTHIKLQSYPILRSLLEKPPLQQNSAKRRAELFLYIMSALVDTTNTISKEGETTETVQKVAVEKALDTESVDASSPIATEETPAVPEMTREEKEKNFKDHMTCGRRFLKTNEYNKAVDALSAATEIAVDIYGEFAEETFDPHFLYGQALFEVAKIEDQVFSNAMTNLPVPNEEDAQANNSIDEEQYGNPETLTEEEREEIKHQVEEALMEEDKIEEDKVAEEQKKNEEPAAEEITEKVAETEEANKEATTESKEASGDEKEEAEEANEKDEGTDGETAMETEEAEAEEDEEEASAMQTAWEILECARKICDNQLEKLTEESVEEAKKWHLRKADVLIVLGEIQTADGKHEDAQKELQNALDVQLKHLPESSRVIAQTYHLLAKAFRQDDKFEEAAANYEKAKNVLIAKQEELKKQVESAVEDAKKEIEEELSEIAEILPEMDAFIDDSKASAEQANKIRETLKKELTGAVQLLTNLSVENKEEIAESASDISNLVRRPTKRPASSEPTEDDAAKKTKTVTEDETEKTKETEHEDKTEETTTA
ncbi:unnamed protein product [Caenorhabditis bovis]|uniref:Tetratricopeptide SHNi-TPR domain-containing protein n=1 Tax=Caenorhabditis bovis TaxID=2654633 RepID=A0A8S1EWY0_9PELO|nr:unnamed protein product [Caenorhabditis bovis]